MLVYTRPLVLQRLVDFRPSCRHDAPTRQYVPTLSLRALVLAWAKCSAVDAPAPLSMQTQMSISEPPTLSPTQLVVYVHTYVCSLSTKYIDDIEHMARLP